MARDLVVTTDIIAGENHPKFPDTKNQYLREIWADFQQGHTLEGKQVDPYEIFAIPETDTYTGTGAALAVDFTATTFTEVLLLLIWSEDDGELYVTHTGGTTIQASDGDVLTDAVTAIDTDGFSLGTGSECNTNTSTYYYCVLAMGTTPDSGSNASPPPWIADATACLGGAASTMANDVEDDLDTKFLVKHTITTGTHDDSEFDDLGKGEKGTFVVDGSALQTVLLSLSDLAIAALWLWDEANFFAFKGANQGKLREYTNTALSAPNNTYVPTLGTGQFQINGASMAESGTTVLDIGSDTTDNDTSIVDSSLYAHTIVNPFSNLGIVYHSTTYKHSGATSLKFNGYSQFVVWPSGTGVTGLAYLPSDFDIEFELLMPAASTMTLTTTRLFRWISLTYGSGGADILISVTNSSGDYVISADITDDTGANITLEGTTDLKDTAFHTINLTRTDGVIYLKADGSTEDSDSLTGTFTPNSLCAFGIDGPLAGPWYIDDIQIDVTTTYFQKAATIHYVAIGED